MITVKKRAGKGDDGRHFMLQCAHRVHHLLPGGESNRASQANNPFRSKL
ncbi:MAG: hypothetical protein KC449_23785 [Anaerolineales bacterium]|nr:hypothetical protein [Anaerolineales bacterium]